VSETQAGIQPKSSSTIGQTSTACPQSEVPGEDIWEYHSSQINMIVDAGSLIESIQTYKIYLSKYII